MRGAPRGSPKFAISHLAFSCGTAASKESSASGSQCAGWPAAWAFPEKPAATPCAIANLGALRLIERSKEGHLVEAHLPSGIRAFRPYLRKSHNPASWPGAVKLEKLDFFKNARLRPAIRARERDVCFYCLRRTSARMRCLDHVVPRAKNGRNSYRNLVLACMECNTLKGERSAADHLSQLYRDGRLTAGQLTARLRAVDVLASGKLRPQVPKLFSERCTGGL